MDERINTALSTLVQDMGMLCLGIGPWTAQFRFWERSGRGTAAAGGPVDSVVQPCAEDAPVPVPESDADITPHLAAAVALALHLDDHALRELEAQRLTWTELSRPFSPWLMDGKTSLHTRRIRWRPNAAPGRIVRDRGLGK